MNTSYILHGFNPPPYSVKMRAILRYCRMVRRRLDPVLEQTGSLRYLA